MLHSTDIHKKNKTAIKKQIVCDSTYMIYAQESQIVETGNRKELTRV